jgi:hypothetical protein
VISIALPMPPPPQNNCGVTESEFSRFGNLEASVRSRDTDDTERWVATSLKPD